MTHNWCWYRVKDTEKKWKTWIKSASLCASTDRCNWRKVKFRKWIVHTTAIIHNFITICSWYIIFLFVSMFYERFCALELSAAKIMLLPSKNFQTLCFRVSSCRHHLSKVCSGRRLCYHLKESHVRKEIWFLLMNRQFTGQLSDARSIIDQIKFVVLWWFNTLVGTVWWCVDKFFH